MGTSTADILAKHGVVADEETLIHYGVPGMRWGKRKARSESKPQTETEKEKIKSMTDDELKSKINRLKLEKEYKTLTAPEINRGRKIVGKILSEVGQEVGKEYVKNHAKRLILEGGTKGAIAVAKAAVK